jgi:hypothetical protein
MNSLEDKGLKLLNSVGLLRLIDSSAATPADRLLSLYACVHAWLRDPAMRESLAQDYSHEVSLAGSCPVLSAYLIDLATQAKISSPAVYVNQMFILLQGALAEELRNPGAGALLEAQDAAKFVMNRARPRAFAHVKQPLIVGSSLILVMALSFMAFSMKPLGTSTSIAPAAPLAEAPLQAQTAMSPDLIGQVIALKDHMETGNCPAPQLINMPPDRVDAYINVVNTNFSNDPASDSQRLRAFLSWYESYMAWECHFKTENQQKNVLGMYK